MGKAGGRRNMREFRVSLAGMVGVVVLLLVNGPALGQAPKEDAAKQATDLLRKALPLLEEVLGPESHLHPVVRVVTLEQLAQVPDSDLEHYLDQHFADLDLASRERALTALRLAKASVALARYPQEDEDVLYLVPGQQAILAHWDERLAAADGPAFLQLVLVHETALHLLNARYQSARLRALRHGPAEEQEIRALIEGKALWATQAVAQKLGTLSYFPLLIERLRHVPDPDSDSGIRAVVQSALRQEADVCDAGLQCFCNLEGEGDKLPNAEQRLFNHPPQDLLLLRTPVFYLRFFDQPNRPDLGSLLDRLKSMLPGRDWHASSDAWTPDMVRAAAKVLGAREQAERVLGSWEDGRLLLLNSSADPRRMIVISLVRHNTAAGARAYYGFTLDMQRKKEQASQGSAGGVGIVQSRSSAWSAAGLEEGARFDELFQLSQGEPTSNCMMLGRSEELVVQITWQDQTPDAEWAKRVVQAILDNSLH
jgi:hypothetical protein